MISLRNLCKAVFLPSVLFMGMTQVSAQKFDEEIVTECAHPDEEAPSLTAVGANKRGKLGNVESVRGVPYLTDNYVNSRLIRFNGEEVQTERMRYNIYANKFETKSGGVVQLLSGELIEFFEIVSADQGKRTFVNTRVFLSESLDKNSFVEVLMDGDVGLYLQERINIKESTSQRNETGSQKDYRYEKELMYYLRVGNDMKPLPSFKKKSLTVFNNQTLEVKAFIKSNRLKFKKPLDVAKVVSYYQSIL